MVPRSCKFQIALSNDFVLMLLFMFRLRKVRVMSALRGFIRRNFNDFCRSTLVTPGYTWGYSHTPLHPSSCRTKRILGDTYGQDNITVLTEDLRMRMKVHRRCSHGRK